ncbi:MAG: DUF6807 family protein [Microscillaceae bacterium]|nr:DUF6807 family protein [Microscillaceae bacterium]
MNKLILAACKFLYSIAGLTFLSGLGLILPDCLSAQKFEAHNKPEGILVSENSQTVFFFQRQTKSQNGRHPRANYLHPLYGLQGEILTEDFPEDHLHHRGIFWAWHQIRLNGQKIADGWDCKNIAWDVRKLSYTANEQPFTLKTQTFWKSKLDSLAAESQRIILEKTRIIVYSTQPDYRIIDFDIHLRGLQKNLEIGGSEDAKGYGGFSLRCKLPDDLAFLYQNQELIPTENALPAGPWLNIQGTFANGNKSGIVVFCHPTNPGEENNWILRKKASMQNAVFPGNQPVPLSHRKGIRLRYRVLVYRNADKMPDLEKIYQEYVKI